MIQTNANASQFGRADYDSTIRVRSIPADEPRFLLRAQDDVAAQAVRLWVWLAAKRGVSPAILELALKQADAMEEWPIHKLPDAGDLTEAQVKQLTFEFDRRAHRAGIDLAPDEALKLLLAERRGYGHALSAVRVMQRALGASYKLLVGLAADIRRPENPVEAAAIERIDRIVADAQGALLVGSRAIAQSGAQPLGEDDADWLRRHQVAMAELDGRIGRLRGDQAAEKHDCDGGARKPKRTPGLLATTLIVSLWGAGVYVAGSYVAWWFLGWALRPIEFLFGLLFAIAASNFASAMVDLHLMRATLGRPAEIAKPDEAQP